MSALNLSQDGPAISRSYQSVVDSPLPSAGAGAGASATYAHWAVYSVQAPLANAFQSDSNKESVLKVFRTGEGELVDLIDEFSDGKIQFAYVKVKDPNSGLPKNVLIAWCGEGVPERTKGYFTSHLAAVSKLLHGYHVQVTARTDADLTPEGIVQKVADASGSNYSGARPVAAKPGPPPVSSKPAFTPSRVGGASSAFNPLGARSREAAPSAPTDADGWGDDAPQVTRSQLTKVDSAYKPTRVNMAELTSQKQEPVRVMPAAPAPSNGADVVKGDYRPVGKVDIAALRRQAQEKGPAADDRPTAVKGSYEPVGKVDIAAIRARAQPSAASANPPPPAAVSPAQTGSSQTLPDRTSAFGDGRMTSMPKPKVANKFAAASSFTGTKPPAPGVHDVKLASAAPVGAASRSFADEGGKTPAQIWAEKKAKQGGTDVLPGTVSDDSRTTPITSQASGSTGQWESGYSGKKWGDVQTTKTGRPAATGLEEDRTGDRQAEDDVGVPAGGVSSIRDRFKNTAPMGVAAGHDDEAAAPPPPPMASRPNVGGIPAPPPQPRSPTPPTPDEIERSGSPIRIIQPVGRGNTAELEPPEERFSPPPVPAASMSEAVAHERRQDLDDQPQAEDSARAAGVQAAATSFGAAAVGSAEPTKGPGGKRALIQYDYEKAEDNELELREGEYVSNIEMVDEDWWMGENQHGETGLFPSNYVELVEGESAADAGAHHEPEPEPEPAPAPAASVEEPAHAGNTATAQYDYEAAEDNELSFPDGAKITNVEFPDEDWWLGEYGGKSGLFPANYVQLDE